MMSFSAKQIHALRRNLKDSHIRTRQLNGRELSYIEGWHAIAEANRIFGHDGWNRETVETKCVLSREIRGTFQAVYIAKVRITVRSGDPVVREGHGTARPRVAHRVRCMTWPSKRRRPMPPNELWRHSASHLAWRFISSHYSQRRSQPRRMVKVASRHRSPATTMWPHPSPQFNRDCCLIGTQLPAQALSGLVQTDHGLTPSASQIMRRERRAVAPVRRRDRDHLRFVASQPCLICGRSPSDPHHLRFMQPRATGLKVSDEFTVPRAMPHPSSPTAPRRKRNELVGSDGDRRTRHRPGRLWDAVGGKIPAVAPAAMIADEGR